MRLDQAKYTAGLYLRLSKDDDNLTESSSIATQRKMLRLFAKENSFFVYDEYIDDGWSGTTFDRPNFQRLIKDIEAKKINLVITKDLSRLGRDYIKTGQYTEIYFPSKSVRYIAINDGYDSAKPYNDIVPFKNVINEMYARDISQKIRSAFLIKMKEGNYIGNFAPYGYKKDPDNKNHLIVDEIAASVVKKIFDMAASGEPPIEIARYLNSEEILTPLEYRCCNNLKLSNEAYSKSREWTSGTISKMLRNIVYIGHTAQGKTTKVSFKSNTQVINHKDEWITVKNTHEPIIEKKIFDIVKTHSLRRTCSKRGDFVNLFSGLAKCMDCGSNMSSIRTRKKDGKANLACGNYKLHGSKKCSNHFIDYDDLCKIVTEAIIEKIQFTKQEKKQLYLEINNIKKNNEYDDIKFSNLECLKNQLNKIDNIIEKLYQDKFNGIIKEDRFKKLLYKYENQSKDINTKINDASSSLESKPKQIAPWMSSYRDFSKKLNEYINIEMLNEEILLKLIDHIEIGQGTYEKNGSYKVKKQDVKIYFRFSGDNDISLYNI